MAPPGPDAVHVAIETSVRPGSVAAARGERSVERELAADRAHASDLLPALTAALAELGAGPADVAAIHVGIGPGSFTGLRVAVATALGLARATGAVLRGVPSVEAIAARALEPGASCAVLLDARSQQLYLASYSLGEGGLEERIAPCVVPADEAASRLPEGVPVLTDGTAAAAAGLEGDARVAPAPAPTAGAVLALGRLALEERGPQAAAQVEPLYLRAFAAKQRKR
jgi:tRNA threonylcarbamoyladenosine biosynthesis protein TsaB